MAQVTLKKTIHHDGKAWTVVDFDPSLGALETFQEAVMAGGNEIKAMIELIAADGDTPIEVVRKMRQSDLEAAMAEVKQLDPLPSSTGSSPVPTGEGGEPSLPIRHTS
ncbi:phage tail assembly protein [Brevundimonas bacteroides]|uniref:phage tail assembly protein n=1 Tax=Brevundimonas bacteroides TaxID=74311 RepID=UPI000495A0DA|nr:phage tail assembly protein [Brevundimonas bacteroides]